VEITDKMMTTFLMKYYAHPLSYTAAEAVANGLAEVLAMPEVRKAIIEPALRTVITELDRQLYVGEAIQATETVRSVALETWGIEL
jgi:TPP-dependent indolepyruvate ferredoxin oxidoreductase alpha subunit